MTVNGTGHRGETGGTIRPYPPRGEWVEQAACRITPTDVFYDRAFTREALRVCARCLVQAECLDYALACETVDPVRGWGVWGGLTSKKRNTLRKQLANTQPQPHQESA